MCNQSLSDLGPASVTDSKKWTIEIIHDEDDSGNKIDEDEQDLPHSNTASEDMPLQPQAKLSHKPSHNHKTSAQKGVRKVTFAPRKVNATSQMLTLPFISSALTDVHAMDVERIRLFSIHIYQFSASEVTMLNKQLTTSSASIELVTVACAFSLELHAFSLFIVLFHVEVGQKESE